MKTFQYWNNKEVPAKLIFEITAENIEEADKKMEESTKLILKKNPWIGCSIQFE